MGFGGGGIWLGSASWRALLALIWRRKIFSKVFCIGFNKTGTSSLEQFFLLMGLATTHDHNWAQCSRDHNDEMLKRYDCFCDGEDADFAYLDATFKNSKFVLNSRGLEDWLVSRVLHTMRPNPVRIGMMKREYDSLGDEAIKLWVRRREDYYRAVFAYFNGRKGDLLVVDICRDSQAFEKLARFLGLSRKKIVGMKIVANESQVKNDLLRQEVRGRVKNVLLALGIAAGEHNTIM